MSFLSLTYLSSFENEIQMAMNVNHGIWKNATIEVEFLRQSLVYELVDILCNQLFIS